MSDFFNYVLEASTNYFLYAKEKNHQLNEQTTKRTNERTSKKKTNGHCLSLEAGDDRGRKTIEDWTNVQRGRTIEDAGRRSRTNIQGRTLDGQELALNERTLTNFGRGSITLRTEKLPTSLSISSGLYLRFVTKKWVTSSRRSSSVIGQIRRDFRLSRDS